MTEPKPKRNVRRCPDCGSSVIEIRTIQYNDKIKRGGKTQSRVIPDLIIPICGECGAKVFTEDVDEQIENTFLEDHLQ